MKCLAAVLVVLALLVSVCGSAWAEDVFSQYGGLGTANPNRPAMSWEAWGEMSHLLPWSGQYPSFLGAPTAPNPAVLNPSPMGGGMYGNGSNPWDGTQAARSDGGLPTAGGEHSFWDWAYYWFGLGWQYGHGNGWMWTGRSGAYQDQQSASGAEQGAWAMALAAFGRMARHVADWMGQVKWWLGGVVGYLDLGLHFLWECLACIVRGVGWWLGKVPEVAWWRVVVMLASIFNPAFAVLARLLPAWRVGGLVDWAMQSSWILAGLNVVLPLDDFLVMLGFLAQFTVVRVFVGAVLEFLGLIGSGSGGGSRAQGIDEVTCAYCSGPLGSCGCFSD